MLRDEIIDPDHVYNDYYTAKLLFGDRRMNERQRLHALNLYVNMGIIHRTGGGFQGCDISATRIKQFKKREGVSRRLDAKALAKLEELLQLAKKNQKTTEGLLHVLQKAVSEMKELRAEQGKGEDWRK